MNKKLLEKIVNMYKSGEISKQNASILLKELEQESEDIAIIGMGCKTSVSDDYHDLWDTMKNRKSHITSCPKERIKLFESVLGEGETSDAFFHQGGIFDDIAMFDYKLFGMKKEEATILDPMQRVMIEVAYRTLEDAGYLGEEKSVNNTGVWIGANFTIKQFTNYLTLIGQSDFDTIMANWTNGLATRISNIFDLRGVSTVIENSCIASIISIYEACNLLKMGKINMALVGSINSILFPDRRVSLNKVFAHEKDVVSRPYDNNPGGNYVGEGAAALLLKPLENAIMDGDRILGVIKSSYVNNNGGKSDFTQSNAEMIAEAVRKSCLEAKVNPEEIGYIEGEGYCEKLEQALEVIGLTQGFQKFTNRKQFCALGAASTNIGYSEVAVGMFNAICCVMALRNKQIPPIYCFEQPSDVLDLCNGPFYINDELKDWNVEEGKKRTAGIFTQGFGGGNGFTIIQEAPESKRKAVYDVKPHIFTFSAHTEESFEHGIKEYINFLQNSDENIMDICYTSSVHRPHYTPYRLAIIATTKEELCNYLIQWDKNRESSKNVYYEKMKLKNPNEHKLMQQEINQALKDKVLEQLAQYYTNGYCIKFSQLFEEKGEIVELPNYHFTKELCWILEKTIK